MQYQLRCRARVTFYSTNNNKSTDLSSTQQHKPVSSGKPCGPGNVNYGLFTIFVNCRFSQSRARVTLEKAPRYQKQIVLVYIGCVYSSILAIQLCMYDHTYSSTASAKETLKNTFRDRLYGFNCVHHHVRSFV